MVDWLLAHPRTCLFAGMGVGKTVATLTAIADLFRGCCIGKVLIVAPLRVATYTWPAEIEAWAHTAGLTYRVIRGTAAQRAEQMRGNEQIHIINVDLFTWLVKECGPKGWGYDMLVLDESTLFKNHRSKRFAALRRIAKKIDYYVALSGTPAPNGLHDLWSQVYPVDFGEQMLGRTVTQFRSHWFEKDWSGFNYNPTPCAQAEIQSAIKPHCLSMEAASEFDLPERIDNTIRVDLGPHLSAYRQLEQDALLEIADAGAITATSAGVLTNKLLQYTSGALYDEAGDWHEVHQIKLDALAEIIEEAAGAPVLVTYQYQFDRERILDAFSQAVALDKDPTTIDRWNAGQIPMLVLHPASGGHGLSLQHGGNIMVHYGLGWSLEQYQQVNERIGPTRQKQSGYDRPVFIHHLIAKGTIDERVMDVLAGKATVQEALMQALKEAQ